MAKKKKLTREDMFTITSAIMEISQDVPEEYRRALVSFYEKEAYKTRKDIDKRMKKTRDEGSSATPEISAVQAFFDKDAKRDTVYSLRAIYREAGLGTKATPQKMGYVLRRVVGVDRVIMEDSFIGYRLNKHYNPMKDSLREREFEKHLEKQK